MPTLTVGSLCSGFGALELAAEAVLGPLDRRFHAEVDPDASKVLAAHYPTIPNLGDIQMVDWVTVEPVEILCAGWPCQGQSNAGKRLGSADERYLWPEVARAIAGLRPAVFLGENVPGLLTIENGSMFARVLADLDELGYAVSWTTVGACKVGGCHHRHRVYLHARRVGGAQDARRLDNAGELAARRTPDGWTTAADALFGDGAAPVVWPAAGHVADGRMWPMTADICGAPETRPKRPVQADGQRGLFDLVSASADELLPTPTARIAMRRGSPSPETAARRIGEEGRRNLEDAIALLPTVTASDTTGPGHSGTGGQNLRTVVSMLPTPTARDAERGAGRTYTEGHPLSEVIALLPTPVATDHDGNAGRRNTHGKPLLPGAVALMPTPRATDGDKGGPNQRGSSGDWALPAAVQPGRFGAYEAAVRRHERALRLAAPEPTEPGRTGRPRLTAAFPEWMMAAPPGWITDHVDRKAAIRIAGNGVVAPAGAHAFRLLGVAEPIPTAGRAA